MISTDLLLNTRARVALAAFAVSVAMGSARGVPAQSTGADTPQIVASGRGEIEIRPDRAEVVLQVISRAPTGARASDANALAARAVLDTLRRGFGLTDQELSTSGYSLQPQMTYADGKPPVLAGYVATNSVRVRTASLARVGAIIDAAIARGASSVSGLSFYAANSDSAKRIALARAVASARADAEAMARAAGGRLGALIDIVGDGASGRQTMPMFSDAMAMRASETPVQPPELVVLANVTGRWRFIPGT